MSSKHGYWTNVSVSSLIGDSNRDPAELITEKAVNVSLAAMQQGWAGPPFDPVALASFLGIRVVPREDIADARTVPSGDILTIEFNPNRSRARVRYSIFHELAHSLFPDCHERVRNRLNHAAMKGDDWQLEMLCNLAAAELAMPIGSLPKLGEEHLDIDRILELREQYAVSAEAMLLRVLKLTQRQAVFFCASRVEKIAPSGSRYLVDYAKPSRRWLGAIPRSGERLPGNTIASECTAIGFTARGQEEWAGLGKVKIECVGVSPYPNRTFPRVVGLLKPPKQSSSSTQWIVYLKGDASQPRGRHSRLLVQLVNDAALTWGAGFSLELRRKWPSLQQSFRSWAMERGHLKLGNVHLAAVDEELMVASMVAQHGYGPSPTPRIRYLAMRDCLVKIGEIAVERGMSVHMPRIGCGLGGGSWDVVSELILNFVCGRGVKVFVYDLPGRHPVGHPQAEISFPA